MKTHVKISTSTLATLDNVLRISRCDYDVVPATMEAKRIIMARKLLGLALGEEAIIDGRVDNLCFPPPFEWPLPCGAQHTEDELT